MADTKISALTAATTPLAGTEVLPIVQSGVTKQVSVADLTAGRAVSALSLSLTNALTVANGGTNASSASITAFNNITGYTATGATGTTSTNLVFSTSPTITTPSVTGDLTMSTGNVVMSNGKGIDFSATPGTGTSELFADYEEGDWTPQVFYGGTQTSYYNRTGRYTKIGRTVICQMSAYVTIVAGQLVIKNLPFTAGANCYGGYGYVHQDSPSSDTITMGVISSGTTECTFLFVNPGTTESSPLLTMIYTV